MDKIMTQNIEQRTLAAVNQYENASGTIDKFAHADETLTTPVGAVKTFPKISKEWDTHSTNLQEKWTGDAAELTADWKAERDALSIKALPVLAWVNSETETNINQQRRFTDGHTYLPKTAPALMNAEPDSNWIAYTADKSDVLSDVFGSKPVDLVNGLVITPTQNQYPKLAAFGAIYELADNSVSYTVKSFSQSVGGDCVIRLSDDTLLIAKKVDAASKDFVVNSTSELTGMNVFPQFGGAIVGDTITEDIESVRINSQRFVLSERVSGTIESINLTAPYFAIINSKKVWLMLYQWHRYGVANIRAFGAKADAFISRVTQIAKAVNTGLQDIKNPDATDNFEMIEAAKSLNLKLGIPQGYYLVSRGIESTHDIDCEGWIVLDDNATSESVGWTIAKSIWPRKTLINRLQVRCHSDQLSTKKIGIKVLDPIARLSNCHADLCHFGIVVATYGVYLDGCVANRNATNLTMLKGGSIDEINDVTVVGGDYTGASEWAMVIGDDRLFNDGTGNPHGVQLSVRDTAFDGAPIWIKNVFGVKLDTIYSEGSGDIAVYIGDDTSNITTRNVIIENHYLSKAKIAIYCSHNTAGIDVRAGYYDQISMCKLYTQNSTNPIQFNKGFSIANVPVDWHTGVNFNTLEDINFQGFTYLDEGIISGTQTIDNGNKLVTGYITSAQKLIPNGSKKTTQSGGRVYDNPASANGTQQDYLFTFNTASDALKFNGGDAIDGNQFIRSVDYVNGTALLSVSRSGAQTLSQVKVRWRTELVSYQAPETTEEYETGDFARNNFTVDTVNFGWTLDNNRTWKPIPIAQP